jgi:hypothetical protein
VDTRRRLQPWESVVALLAAAVAVALNITATIQLFAPASTFGYQLTYGARRHVESVDPGTAAARAGMVAGDHTDFTRSSLHDRIVGLGYQPSTPGESITFGLIHNGRERQVTLVSRRPTAAESAQATFSPLPSFLQLAGFAYIVVALTILLRRPSRMTWGLFLYLLSVTNITSYRLPNGLFVIAQFGSDILSIAGPIGLVIFAARFPDEPVRGWKAWLDRLAIPAGILFAIPNLAWDGTELFLGRNPPGWMTLGSALAALVLILIAAATLAATYVATAVQERQRLQWVIAGVLMTLVSYAAGWAKYLTTAYPIVTSGPVVWISAALYAIAPFALAYAVVRQRVFDISFVISRTVVYTVLTATIFALFALIEWLVGRVLEHSGAAIVFLAIAAIVIAFWLDAIHAKVEYLVDSMLFRRRHQAEKRLASIAAGLPYAENAAAVEDALLHEPQLALALSSATLFKRDATGEYVRDGTALDHSIALQLKGLRGPLRLHDLAGWSEEPDGENHVGVLAIPIFVRSRLEAVAVYGAHRNGEDIDPDELALLEKVGVAAGSAYDYLNTLRLTRETTKWHNLAERQGREIAALRERLSQTNGQR